MGYQVIRQPDGKLAIWSSYTDGWAVLDAEPGEAVEWFAELEAQRARRDAERVVGHVVAGEPHKAYYQFAMSFEEADAQTDEKAADLRVQWDAEAQANSQPG